MYSPKDYNTTQCMCDRRGNTHKKTNQWLMVYRLPAAYLWWTWEMLNTLQLFSRIVKAKLLHHFCCTFFFYRIHKYQLSYTLCEYFILKGSVEMVQNDLQYYMLTNMFSFSSSSFSFKMTTIHTQCGKKVVKYWSKPSNGVIAFLFSLMSHWYMLNWTYKTVCFATLT